MADKNILPVQGSPIIGPTTSPSPEAEYVRTKLGWSGNERIRCMTGSRGASAVIENGVALNPGKICLALMDSAAKAPTLNFGIMSTYLDLAASKGYAHMEESADYVFSQMFQAAMNNANSTPRDKNGDPVAWPQARLDNGKTINVSTAAALDLGYTAAAINLQKGVKGASGMEMRTDEEIDRFALACVKVDKATYGNCLATGMEYGNRHLPAILEQRRVVFGK